MQQDVNALDELLPEPSAFSVMDRLYLDRRFPSDSA
jgi:hypothetical protein